MQERIQTAPPTCTLCTLAEGRTQVVYPDVFTNTDDPFTVMVVGEAPGANEDKKGVPFVGASGKILREELLNLPGTVVITNVVKCRPPDNRDPHVAEKKACRPFLDEEVKHYNPDLILLVGRHAASSFLGKQVGSFTQASGQLFEGRLMPLIHPAATMYNRKKNRPVWDQSWEAVWTIVNDKVGKERGTIPLSSNDSDRQKKLDNWLKP